METPRPASSAAELHRDVLAVARRRPGTRRAAIDGARRDSVSTSPRTQRQQRRVIDPDPSSGAGHCASSGVISDDPGAPGDLERVLDGTPLRAVARHRSSALAATPGE